MRITSTGAFPRAFAAARPPKPPPTITTRGVFDFRASAPLIELRLASFIHLFLNLLWREISENLGFSRRRLDRGPNQLTERLLACNCSRLCEAAIDWRLTQTPYKLFFKMEVLAAI